jgi:dTMP kinase
MFITLEGIDGSGKSTVARRLAEQLQLRGADVLLTREPGGTAVGERVRSLVLDFGHDRLCAETEALLFTASRAQLVADVIHPALRDGRVVISDRFADSTLAYQWGGRGLDRSALEGMQTLALQGIRPDLTFLFDVSPERALERRRKEAEQVNRLDIESLAFYERVRNAYAILASENPNTWRIIDGSQTIEQVWDDVVVALNDNRFAGIKITAER